MPQRRRRRRRDDDDPGKRRKRRRRPDDDDPGKPKPGGKGQSQGVKEAGMRTSATTTAPASPPAAGGQDEDDLDAFYSSGHGPVMHYDRSEAEAAQSEAGEAGSSG